jgi:hypothetical protein
MSNLVEPFMHTLSQAMRNVLRNHSLEKFCKLRGFLQFMQEMAKATSVYVDFMGQDIENMSHIEAFDYFGEAWSKAGRLNTIIILSLKYFATFGSH